MRRTAADAASHIPVSSYLLASTLFHPLRALELMLLLLDFVPTCEVLCAFGENGRRSFAEIGYFHSVSFICVRTSVHSAQRDGRERQLQTRNSFNVQVCARARVCMRIDDAMREEEQC